MRERLVVVSFFVAFVTETFVCARQDGGGGAAAEVSRTGRRLERRKVEERKEGGVVRASRCLGLEGGRERHSGGAELVWLGVPLLLFLSFFAECEKQPMGVRISAKARQSSRREADAASGAP